MFFVTPVSIYTISPESVDNFLIIISNLLRDKGIDFPAAAELDGDIIWLHRANHAIYVGCRLRRDMGSANKPNRLRLDEILAPGWGRAETLLLDENQCPVIGEIEQLRESSGDCGA